jgi:tripartite-type tricarboxylate transporter receptor subunit TctC
VLWDNVTLPFKNVKEFVAAARSADPPFKMGGTDQREDHVLTVFMEKKPAQFAYLPYKSGGRPLHSWSAITPPPTSTILRRISKSGAPGRFARCACSTRNGSPTRPVTDTMSWNDIPTCKEEGLDVQYLMLRAMFHPGKSRPTRPFYVKPVKKLTQTAEYKGT